MRVLTPEERNDLIIAVGCPSNIAENALRRWGEELSVPPAIALFNDYTEGASRYFENSFGRRIHTVSPKAAISWAAANWLPFETGNSLNGVIINLAGVGFRINREQITQEGANISDIEIQASRNRMPRLKKGEARAGRPLGPPIEELLAQFTDSRSGHALIIDDRVQSGQSLIHLRDLLGRSNFAVKAAVGHSEMPLTEAKTYFGDTFFAEIFNFHDSSEKLEWGHLVETGVQRPVLGEELQDLLGCSPAGGTVVCRGYIDAHEEIIKFHKLVKEKLFKGLISTIASYASIELSADGPTTENDVSSALEDSLDNLVIIQDRDRFFKHLTKRCNQRIPVEREKLLLKNSSKPQPQELRELDKATRWGADDIDLLFDGILKLKSHPEFNTRTPDIRRIGNFWPFKKAHTLNTVCAMTEVEWAKYSLNDIQRSILLIDQLQQQFSPITAELIPQLAPHAVRTLMSSKRITDPVDQLRELQQTLEEQIRTGSITPLVNL